MRIDQPTDDMGLRRLQTENRTSGEVKQPQKVAPTPPLNRSHEPQEQIHERKQQDRRRDERRRRNTTPPLDTRDNRERRQADRRRDDREGQDNAEQPPHGIDVIV